MSAPSFELLLSRQTQRREIIISSSVFGATLIDYPKQSALGDLSVECIDRDLLVDLKYR